MALRFYNNLTRQLEDFKPLNGNTVSIYSCGPTVYDVSHIGHARSCITWDLLSRYMSFKGFDVKWIRNITNVDDKIVKRSKEIGCSSDQLSRAFTYEFWNDMNALNISWPAFEPRATDYMQQMFDFIQNLIDQGFAYEANGDVYFRVTKHKDYGQLKGLSIDKLKEGVARVDENDKKEDQLDFALWKAFPTEPETSFESPWGIGRPGWHLECSTMIASLLKELNLGDTLDIHSGGDDLIFPHHENECAQSECLTGKPLARFWMHNGMVMINGAKMSKSENNFFTIKDLLQQFKSNTIRYFSLSTHYKKQINYSIEALEAAQTGLDSLLKFIKPVLAENNTKSQFKVMDFDQAELNKGLIDEFSALMDNDLNSPQALALLFENKKAGNEVTIAYLLQVLGFDLFEVLNSKQDDSKLSQALDSSVRLLLTMRKQARVDKNYSLGDQIRDDLNSVGIEIKDHRDKESEWFLK